MPRTYPRHLSRSALLGGAALLSAIAVNTASAADQAASDAAETSTIEITGKKNSPVAQAVQQKPQATSVVDQQKLQDTNATKLSDIAGQTPGLLISPSRPSVNNISAFIRGIGEQDAQGEPSVGIFIDGIYQPRNLGANLDLLGVQDITIERGPVGFAGGHDAEGGAIRINLTPPSNKPSLEAELGYGNYNQVTASVAGSGPIVEDKVFGRLAVSLQRRDGIDYNATTNESTNNIDTLSSRGKLRFTPNDRLEINLGFDGTLDNSQAQSYGDQLRPNKFVSYNPLVPTANFNQLGGNLTVDYRLSDTTKLKSITSIRGFYQDAVFNNNPDYFARGSQPVIYRDRSYEQDFRLIGNYDRVDLTTGFYAFHEDWQTDRRGNSATYPLNPAQIVYTPVDTSIEQVNTQLAYYGEAKLHFTQRLTGTAGVRADYQYHSNNQAMYSLLGNGRPPWTQASNGVPNVATILYATRGPLIWATGKVDQEWFNILPKGVLEYAITPDIRPYLSVSQGQKSAGYDFRAILPTSERQALLPYNPEHLTTLEMGLKAKVLDGKLDYQTALFYNDFQQIQLTTVDPTNNISRRYNAGNAHSQGIEAQVSAKPLPGWTVDASGTLMEAVLGTYAGVPGRAVYQNGLVLNTTPFPGAQLPYSPHAQANIATSYEVPIAMPGVWRVFGDTTLQTSYYTDATNISQQRIPEKVIANLGVSYTSEDGRWSATFTAKNITGHRYPASQQYTVSSPSGRPILYSTAWTDPLLVFFAVRYSL